MAEMTVSERIRSWLAVGASLADEVALLEPPPIEPPPVDPPPPPPPPIDPPPVEPVAERPAEMVRALGSSFVCFNDWNAGQRYNRWQDLLILKGATKLAFRVLGAGGAKVAFSGATYTLTIDGAPVATVTPAVGALVASFEFDAALLSEGWRVLDIEGGESCAFFPFFVLHGEAAPPQDWMPACTSTYEHKGPANHRIAWVPAVHAPTVLPLVKRTSYPHFSDAKPRAQLWRDEIVPVRNGDIRRPNISKEGILNTFNLQWYTWAHFIAKLPSLPLLDGPRGVGTLGYATHIEIGTFVNPITNVPGHMLYVLDPWRVVRIKPNGHITTLFGYRHKPTPSHWKGPQELELIGDWSGIPEERRGGREFWGMCWKPMSLHTDTTAQPVPEENNLQPHLGAGPTMFVPDSQNNRVLKAVFGGASSDQGLAARHDIPPIITEFLIGLSDPWDVVEWGGKLIVSERGAHRICQYSMETGELERVIVQGAALSRVNINRFVERLAPIQAIQAEDCVGPEGLYIVDGDRWLYFGSEAMQQVKRVHLDDGRIELVKGYVSGKNQYLKIAVSDGTFGPRGTVFITSWSNALFGAPAAFLPDGTQWSVAASSSASTPRGRGGDWDVMLYNSAVACRDGRLVYGSAGEGLVMLSAGLPDDPVVDRKLFIAGRAEWLASGNRMKHGDNGFSFCGEPLPWGESAAQNYYLTWNGHNA